MTRLTLKHVQDMDYNGVANYLRDFIRGFVASSGAKGVVVGVSGGVDSATTLALSVEALGSNRILALIMPDTRVTPGKDIEDAERLCKNYGVDYKIVKIDELVDTYKSLLGDASKRTIGNLRARIRMTILYWFANEHNMVVMGTGDRSELLIGYYTKFGDGAADAMPIAVLYKTQVRRLALELGVPREIALKPSAPRLWEDHLAEKELGMSYESIDLILFALFDLALGPKEASKLTGVSEEDVERVLKMHRSSLHKMVGVPTPNLEVVKRYWHGLEEAMKIVSSSVSSQHAT